MAYEEIAFLYTLIISVFDIEANFFFSNTFDIKSLIEDENYFSLCCK